MKKLTKWFCLAFCLALLCILLPRLSLTAHAEVVSGYCGGEGDGANLTWTLDTDNGVLTITGTGEMDDWANEWMTPWYTYQDSIKTVVISDGVSGIGVKAFEYCSSITDVSIGIGVTNIRIDAFCYCTSLRSVSFPDSVISIGYEAFRNCTGLKSVTIPKSVTSINGAAFYGCTSVETVAIDTPKVENWFSHSTTLKSVILGPNVREIGNFAFSCYSGLTDILIPEGVTNISYRAFENCDALKSILIPDSVVSIGQEAFLGCDALTSVTIGDGVAAIGNAAFKDCAALKDIFFGSGVTEIYSYAFSGCEALENVYLSDLTAWCQINYYGMGHLEDGLLSNVENLYYNGERITDLVVPDGVLEIKYATFAGYKNLNSVTIPASVTGIGISAFEGCTALEQVTLGVGVTQIKPNAFRDTAMYLDRSNWQNGLFYVDDWLIEADKSQIPRSVVIRAGTRGIADRAFFMMDVFTSALPGGLRVIGDEAFAGCSMLKSVSIPDSVEVIGNSAFHSCAALEQVSIPQDLTEISDHAFYSCRSLKSVEIPEGVTFIGSGAFGDCVSLTSAGIPDCVTCIGPYAFGGCSSLSALSLPDGLAFISEKAFYQCEALTDLVLPVGLSEIGEKAFYCCAGAFHGEVDLTNLTRIGYAAFAGCPDISGFVVGETNLNYSVDQYGVLFNKDKTELLSCPGGYAGSYTIPESVVTISQNAFEKCDGLSGVILGKSVAEFSWDPVWFSFRECSNLEFFRVSPENPAFSSDAAGLLFNKDQTVLLRCPYGCSGSCTVPEGVTTIYPYAFRGCDKLTEITLPASIKDIDTETLRITPPDEFPPTISQARLAEIRVSEDNPYYSSDASGVLFNKDKTVLLCCPEGFSGSYTIPESVNSVATLAFAGCNAVTTVVIPENVTELCGFAFSQCTGLQEITIPASISVIESYQFEFCVNLERVTISEGVTRIDQDAFAYCTKLANVSIPASITEIGIWAFYGCAGLEEFDVAPDNENYTAEDGVLFNRDKTVLIQCPAKKAGVYVIPEGVETVGGRAFFECAELTEVVMPDSLTMIRYGAFLNCSSLHEITIPKSVSTIEHYAFGYIEEGYYESNWLYPMDHFVIRGVPDTEAERYANANEILFISVISPFEDVKTGKYYFDAVMWAFRHKPYQITKGVDDTHFKPNQTCNRAQVVSFLWNAMGKPEPDMGDNPFVDVKPGKYYYDAVMWAIRHVPPITKGADDTHFNPNGLCNRAQVVSFLWNTMGKPEPTSTDNPFVDVKPSKYYYKAVLWAVENGITKGVDATHFGPNQTCTRGQVVTFLYNTLAK